MSNIETAQPERLPSLAKKNDVNGVSKCLEQDTPSLIEQRDAMLMAAKFGHIEVIACLVSYGISVNIASDKGTTPLMQAAHRGHSDCCKLLLNSNANVNEQNEKQKTPLMLAVLCGHVHVAETLLKHGRADTEATECSGRTALYLAASIGNVEVVKTLLKYKSNKNTETNTKLTPLMAAARGGYDEILNLFLENISDGKNDDINNSSSIEYNNNYIKDIDLQDQYGRTALIIAASVGKTTSCKLLIKHGADINSQSDNGTTALMAAIDGKAEIECIEYLIEEANSIVSLCNIQGASALSFAAKRG
jgi:ankyrin repeat protein